MTKYEVKNGYYVVGGQYEPIVHGWAKTLLGAKRIASRNEELWDNFRGWHTPKIYAAKDCDENGYPLSEWEGVSPVAIKRFGKWEE